MKIDGYYVVWKYENDFFKTKDDFEIKNVTSCIIKDGDKIEIGIGKTILNPLDREDKEIARK